MELYRKLAALRCFTYQDLVRLTGSESAAQWHVKRYLQKGYIERVRRNLYAVISLETEQPVANRYQLATSVAEDACVSHHSAFEYYGCANQVFYEVYFATARRVRPFLYDGLQYHPVATRGAAGVAKNADGVRVTTLERTVIDGISDFDCMGGLEELLRCLLLVPALHSEGLLEALELYGQGLLYQKAGYILGSVATELPLPAQFFEECERRSSAAKAYLFARRDDFVLHTRWKLFAPRDLKRILDKGAGIDGAL